ncbi:tyrosine-type recombinase/integrase [Arthrobacter sp. NPDC057013]|uniref:tyrosine-type recombinase/integrase n=1 Tax=Arthrobacter sp. NPDC057013 TaxID=3345999 RepID=UPI003634876B
MTKEHLIDVQPIRTVEDIDSMKWALKRHASERDYMLFLVGINTGLRVSDILKFKTTDIVKLKGKKRKELTIQEGKTKKKRVVNLTGVYEELYAYAVQNASEWLFPSRKGDKSISGIQAYRQLVKAGEFAGLEAIGTHTMRKTFGYWYYKKTKDVATLMSIFNHSSQDITKRYIGISQEEINDTLDDFVL